MKLTDNEKRQLNDLRDRLGCRAPSPSAKTSTTGATRSAPPSSPRRLTPPSRTNVARLRGVLQALRGLERDDADAEQIKTTVRRAKQTIRNCGIDAPGDANRRLAAAILAKITRLAVRIQT